MLSEKDPEVQRLIERATSTFPEGALEVRDHWDGDLAAIGFARKGEDSKLLYVRVRPESGSYTVIREYGASIDGQRNVSSGEHLTLDKVLAELASHLDLTPRP